MCIRDRGKAVAARRMFAEAVGREAARQREAGLAGGNDVEAVSYTHLTLPTSDLV